MLKRIVWLMKRFKRKLQMDIYLLFNNPCKPSKPLNVDIRALCEYAERTNKKRLTRKEVKQFYLN